ncbi:MAG: 50S ribosomal protein L18 [Desulfatibacillaceae bacterium]
MGRLVEKQRTRVRRKRRVRSKVYGTAQRPRLTVFRSARHMYAQVVEDETGTTLASASTLEKEVRDRPAFESKVQAAEFIGKLVGERAKAKGVSKVVFDRNGYLYHGRVKAVSSGAREAGLDF